MFGVSFPELVVVLVIALVIFGPEKLPAIARELGRWSAQLKRHSDSFRREFYNSVYTPAADIQERVRREARALTAAEPNASLPLPPPADAGKTSEGTAPNSPAALTGGEPDRSASVDNGVSGENKGGAGGTE